MSAHAIIALPTRRYSFSYWDASQQWPTASVCAKHQRVLDVARDKYHLPDTRDWLLPHDLSDNDWEPAVVPSPECLAQAIDLQRWTEYLLTFPEGRFEGRLLRYVYRLQAQRRGWVAMDGSVRLQMLRNAFEKEYQELARLHEMPFLAHVAGANAGYLGHLFREYAGLRHPAKHIALIRFLIQEPEQFMATYESVEAAESTGNLSSVEAKLKEQQGVFRKLILERDYSVNAACKIAGIPPSQAIRFLKREGIAFNQRPRVLSTDMQSQLETMLKAGEERSDIALALGIRKAFIKDYLTERPELRQVWDRARTTNRRERYRGHFLQILEEHPGVPIKRIRRISGNGFEWLYRNDLEWLKGHLPGIWQRSV